MNLYVKNEFPKNAEEMIKDYMEIGLNEEDSVKASIIALNFALKAGLYPGIEPTVQKMLNYLTGVGKNVRQPIL